MSLGKIGVHGSNSGRADTRLMLKTGRFRASYVVQSSASPGGSAYRESLVNFRQRWITAFLCAVVLCGSDDVNRMEVPRAAGCR